MNVELQTPYRSPAGSVYVVDLIGIPVPPAPVIGSLS